VAARFLDPMTDSEPEHMVCSKCGKPALMEYWEWHDMPEDELQCPHCGKQVKIGKWIPGIPTIETQPCLMCNGTGKIYKR